MLNVIYVICWSNFKTFKIQHQPYDTRIRFNLGLHMSCSSLGGDAILKGLGGNYVNADILTFEGVAEAPLRSFRRWTDTLSRINNLVNLKCKI